MVLADPIVHFVKRSITKVTESDLRPEARLVILLFSG